MSFASFISENRWQKSASFLLAVLIWLTVNAELSRGGAPSRTRLFLNIPVGQLDSSGIGTNRFRVSPAVVNVKVEGRPETLQLLRPDELEVYVTISSGEVRPQFLGRVQVRAPGVRSAEAIPEEVKVERGP